MFLVTTANQNLWKTDEKILFLGEWCKIYDQKHIWSKLDHETLPSHWDRWEDLNKHYKCLERIYENYISSLVLNLNDFHNEDHSVRYWRIILGPWLSNFIGVIYDRYLSIQSAAKSNKAIHTWIPPLIGERWIPKDTATFNSRACGDINFNLYLYGQIITKLGKIPFEVKEDPAFLDPEDKWKSESFSIFENIKRNIKSFLGKISNEIPDRYNQIVFSSSNLSFVNMLKLQFSLSQIPYLVSPYVVSSTTPIEKDRRKNIKLPKGNTEFEDLLNSLMVEQFPTSFLEGYSELHKNSLDAFPKNPKIIFTSSEFLANEGFKIWSATQIEKNAKLVLAQHGGGYGIAGPLVTESHEKKISDKYFSWGWASKKESKIVPMDSGKLQGSQYNIKPDPNGIILYVTVSWPIYFLRIDHITVGNHSPEYFLRQKHFFKFVDPEVFEMLLLRLYKCDYGWKEKQRLADLDPLPKSYSGKDSIFSQIKKSRLCVHDYLGTSWLETLSMNFPTVVFWDPTRVKIIKSAQPYLDDLRRVNILHDTPESAANLVNEIYEDPLTWWMSQERQQAKDKFCYKFARKSENWLQEWKEELLKMVR